MELNKNMNQLLRKMKIKYLAGILFWGTVIMFGCANQTELEVIETRCESIIDPVGIDNPQPAFSWIVNSEKRGTRQAACQVIFADNEKDIRRNKGTLWDSGKITGDEKNAMFYHGPRIAE